MLDIVLDGFVNSFSEGRSLATLPPDVRFEAFVAHSVFHKYHQSDAPDIEEHLTGDSGDAGIDAIAIFVNDRPVLSEDDIDFFTKRLGHLDVEFAFVQAKTSNTFNAKEIGNTFFGIEQFFNAVQDKPTSITFNEEVTRHIQLAKHVYAQGIRNKNNPACIVYYATAGSWSEAADPLGRFEHGVATLESMNIFSSVGYRAIDSELLKAIYRDAQRAVTKEVEISRITAFPRVTGAEGVEQAYIGLIPGPEFISLVSTTDGELNRELFYDNVRDFQGSANPVNSDIERTLASEPARHTFPLLNNGITVVAQDLTRTGDVFTLSNFQIVNGCQTTHVLFQNKHSIDDSTSIPIKLVVTADRDIIAEVIKATNRQTAVQLEALETLTPFHKELEDFYNERESTRPHSDRIYYERRSKQYTLDNISPKNIVTLTAQIKSFVGMFLNEPHSHPRYYGELLRSYGSSEGKLFSPDHKPAPYYASGVSFVTVEQWIKSLRSRADRRLLLAYKYHLLMLLRASIAGPRIPWMNSKEITPYALEIVDALRQPDRAQEECAKAATILKTRLAEYPRRRGERNPPHRLRDFTATLIGDRLSGRQEPAVSEDEPSLADTESPGDIVWFDDFKNYGFVALETGGDYIFVHGSEMGAVPYHMRLAGMKVLFQVVPDRRTPGRVKAVSVRVDEKRRG